jgi:hypothetical protein
MKVGEHHVERLLVEELERIASLWVPTIAAFLFSSWEVPERHACRR